MKRHLLTILTQTPLHVGAGSSVGAIDQPIQRERHTGFPVIPATALKGTFADLWNDRSDGEKLARSSTGKWLFGEGSDSNAAAAGALLFSEARLIAFPVRSAKGCFAWITCPLILERALRDGVISHSVPAEPKDQEAIFKTDGKLALDGSKVVLEEYCFNSTGAFPVGLAQELADLVDDPLVKSIAERLVILSNGMMTHFVTTTCEIAQHVRINDETGTAMKGGLFNQENVPADTLFLAGIHATPSRVQSELFKQKSSADALTEFGSTIREAALFQFGGDASTGLGFCGVTLIEREAK